MDKWFKIDNAGHIYSAITSTRVTTFFRVSVTLKDSINVEVGNETLTKVLKRFPFLDVQIKQGLFWHYLDKSAMVCELQEEKFYPCMNVYIKNESIHLFRILYFNNKLSFEFSHIVLDGKSALVFINTFLIEYYKSLGVESTHEEMYNLDYYDEKERENSFLKYYNKNIPGVRSTLMAHKLPFSLCEKGSFFVLTGLIKLDEIKPISKKYNCSIYIFLMAVYIKSIIDISTEPIKRPIVINAPVSLKNFYESNTLSNFFVSLTPTIDPRICDFTLEQIIEDLKRYFEYNLHERVLCQYISTSVKYENSILFKAMPLFLKSLILPTIYQYFGENTYTSSISNLGVFEVPKELEEYIKRVDIFPAPSQNNIVKTAMVTYKDTLSFSFSKLTNDTSLERAFFSNLRKMGIHSLIDDNGGI